MKDAQGVLEIQIRHAVVGQHGVPAALLDRRFQLLDTRHAMAAGRQAVLLQVAHDESEIGLLVLDDQKIEVRAHISISSCRVSSARRIVFVFIALPCF